MKLTEERLSTVVEKHNKRRFRVEYLRSPYAGEVITIVTPKTDGETLTASDVEGFLRTGSYFKEADNGISF